MAKSIRDQIIDAVISAVSGKYRLPGPFDDKELPLTAVADSEETAATSEHGASSIEFPIAVARAEKNDSTDAKALKAKANDLFASIIKEALIDGTFGGLAEETEYTGGGILIEPGKRCMAEAQFIVRYQTVHGDPYTQA